MNYINDMNDISMNFMIEYFLCVLQKEKEKEEGKKEKKEMNASVDVTFILGCIG